MAKYNDLLKEKFSNWNDLEKKIEHLPTSQLKGEVFEEFIFAYLSLKKQFYQLKDVYRSKEIPKEFLEKYKIEKKDSGIDGLLVFNDGKIAGYQVKFRTNRSKPLLISLGKGISGKPVFANLAKAPHMLIAGTTGSGKSVTIHTLITSLLYRNSPEDLKFIFIDPKRVEKIWQNKAIK
jgi:DNA segregation ATPase FtsK/SpoIIIE-like protein